MINLPRSSAEAVFWPLLYTSDFILLQGNSISKTESYITRTAEPTSIEFENKFSELSREALLPNSNRRLIIAIDNLDRVDSQDALSIWSTLQTFLQERRDNDQETFQQIIFLVSFDQDGLKKIWSSENIEKPNKQLIELNEQNINQDAEENVPENSASVINQRDIAQSFIDKSFSLKFEVPPPVLSDWKKFLSQKISEALPDHSEIERESIVNIYDLWLKETKLNPTPRRLKIFVNQVGVINRQWPTPIEDEIGEFSLASIAYYVLLRRHPNFRNIPKHLKSGFLPHESIKQEIGPRLIEDLSGLAHNVKGEHGVQLVIGEDVSNAMFSGDHAELINLAERYQDGFWANLDQIGIGIHEATDKQICNSITALNNSVLPASVCDFILLACYASGLMLLIDVWSDDLERKELADGWSNKSRPIGRKTIATGTLEIAAAVCDLAGVASRGSADSRATLGQCLQAG